MAVPRAPRATAGPPDTLAGMFRHSAPPTRRGALALAGTAAAGFLGLLPASGGGTDPVATLAWLCLIAPASGALAGAAGVRLFPLGLGVPGLWLCVLVWADVSSGGDLPAPIWGALVVAGLHAFGLGLGLLAPRRPWALAGGLSFALLLATGLCVQGGLGERSWAEAHPGLARSLVELSPLVLVTECAGLDWTHAQPEMYALSGVEWFQRRSYRGPLAAPVVLLVGCTLATTASRRRRRLDGPAEAPR